MRDPRPFIVTKNGRFLFVIHARSLEQVRTLLAANRTKSGAGVQLEMGTAFRASLFAPGCNTRELRKNNTNAEFSKLVEALRKALSQVN